MQTGFSCPSSVPHDDQRQQLCKCHGGSMKSEEEEMEKARNLGGERICSGSIGQTSRPFRDDLRSDWLLRRSSGLRRRPPVPPGTRTRPPFLCCHQEHSQTREAENVHPAWSRTFTTPVTPAQANAHMRALSLSLCLPLITRTISRINGDGFGSPARWRPPEARWSLQPPPPPRKFHI